MPASAPSHCCLSRITRAFSAREVMTAGSTSAETLMTRLPFLWWMLVTPGVVSKLAMRPSSVRPPMRFGMPSRRSVAMSRW